MRIGDAGDVQQGVQLLLLGRAGDTEAEPVGGDAGEQRAHAGKRTQPRKIFVAKPLPPARDDPPAELAVLRDAGQRGQELVAAHADEPPDGAQVAGEAEFLQRLLPGGGVGVVAVDQGPIDVENHRALAHDGKLATDSWIGDWPWLSIARSMGSFGGRSNAEAVRSDHLWGCFRFARRGMHDRDSDGGAASRDHREDRAAGGGGVARAARRTGTATPTRSSTISTDQVMHIGYGAALGAGYALAARGQARNVVAPGLAYGVGAWLAGSWLLLPLLRAKQAAWLKRPSENAVDLLAHLVFGAATALVSAELAAQPDRGPSSDWSRRATRVG